MQIEHSLPTMPELSEDKVAASHGFSWFIATVFIVGETAGSGLVAMSNAVMHTGFIGGSVLLSLLCLVMAHTAATLGRNQMTMHRRWPQYARQSCRDPYPEMAQRAMGPIARSMTKFCVYFTTFGGVAVFSLLAAKNISHLLSLFDLHIGFCTLLPVLGVLMWPFMMLRSPMNFWQVSICAAASTIVAVVLILIGVSNDFTPCFEHAAYSPITPESFSLGFGTIVFAYGGHPALPTIQHDMQNPKLFPRAVAVSYIAMFVFYFPVSIFGYATYGSSMSDSIITSIQSPLLRHLINTLITIHVLFSILIIINPLHQAMEHTFRVKLTFGIGRVLVRSAVFFAALFTAATMPNFGVFLDLIGGSTMTILALIFPGLFALYLEAGEAKRKELIRTGIKLTKEDEQQVNILEVLRFTSRKRLLLESSVIALGIICGLVSTGNAVRQMFQSSLSTPCYLQPYREDHVATENGISCCGMFGNITRYDSTVCHE